MSCNICTNTFNKCTRMKVVCGQCEFEACKSCMRSYIVTTNVGPTPKCMNCAAAFSTKFLVTQLNRSWILSGKYKETRTANLLDIEMGKIPDTMQAAEAENERRKLEDQNAEFRKRIRILEGEKNRYSNAIIANDYLSRGREVPDRFATDLVQGTPIQWGENKEQKKKFIMACPGEECKGFLSSGYKCGLCENFTCSNCLIVVGKTKNPEHVCKDEDKLSAELIKKETKPCPGCGERIYKISGCDQMFCVSCHCAFSWNTGTIETGQIHNPHFYEIQRQGGTIMRNVGDVPCGGMPSIGRILRNMFRVSRVYTEDAKSIPYAEDITDFSDKLQLLHRNLHELQTYDIDRCRTNIRERPSVNRSSRIQYILGDIDKNIFGTNVYQNDIGLQQATDKLHILEILNVCGIETFRDIVENDAIKALNSLALEWKKREDTRHGKISHEDENKLNGIIKDIFAFTQNSFSNLDLVRKYCNEQLKELSMTYNCTICDWNENLSKNMGKKYTLKGELVGSAGRKRAEAMAAAAAEC